MCWSRWYTQAPLPPPLQSAPRPVLEKRFMVPPIASIYLSNSHPPSQAHTKVTLAQSIPSSFPKRTAVLLLGHGISSNSDTLSTFKLSAPLAPHAPQPIFPTTIIVIAAFASASVNHQNNNHTGPKAGLGGKTSARSRATEPDLTINHRSHPLAIASSSLSFPSVDCPPRIRILH